MQSPWGELAVSDAHVHFFSHAFFSALAKQKQAAVDDLGPMLGWQMPPIEPEKLAEQWAAELDRYGVTRAALIASIPGDEGSVAAAIENFPERFHGYFLFDPLLPDAAARLRAALTAGLRGICLFPAMQRYAIHDERVRPVFEIAAGFPGAVVFVHCGALSVGVRQKLGLPSLFDLRFSNPIDLHAIALQFPQVNFVIPHFGAGYLREALMVCDLCPNVYLDTSSSNRWIRYQPESLDLKAVFRRALDVAGPRRLLFGSDSSFFPRGWNAAIFNQQATILHELGVSGEDAALMFGGNLERILGSVGSGEQTHIDTS
ncbi:MAG: amidohydrolase family protein [Acidobacteriota bacterium]|nr:amidohydrolase family protein [Acidobacteriota bacterium]